MLPDYATDDTTPSVMYVTLFQCAPFLIRWNGDIAGQVEEGKIYVFEVTDQLLEIPLTEYERNLPDPEWLFPQYVIHLSGFREALESDWGLDSVHLSYELCDKT